MLHGAGRGRRRHGIGALLMVVHRAFGLCRVSKNQGRDNANGQILQVAILSHPAIKERHDGIEVVTGL